MSMPRRLLAFSFKIFLLPQTSLFVSVRIQRLRITAYHSGIVPDKDMFGAKVSHKLKRHPYG
jgi:hypothetical protein